MNRRTFLAQGTVGFGLAAHGSLFPNHSMTGEAEGLGQVASAFPGVPVEAFSEPAYVSSDKSGETRTWLIGNGLVERVVKFTPGRGLYTEALRQKVSGTDFLRGSLEGEYSGAEFAFEADSEWFVGAVRKPPADFTFVDSNSKGVIPSGELLEVHLRARQRPLDVSVFYAIYGGHPVVRKWIAIKNGEERTIRLSHLGFESLSLMSAAPDEEILRVYYGVYPREIFYTGRAEDAAMVQVNPRTCEGFIVMNGAPGWMKRTEMGGWGKNIEAMYDTDLFPFERSLRPGETFTSAKCGLACFIEGGGMSDPRWSIPTYTSQVLMKKGTSFKPPWVYNTYEPFHFGVPATIVSELVRSAGKIGFDIFTLDAGWEKLWGENDVSSKNFPQGLDPVRAEVELQGMHLGLWVPMTVIRPETKVYREHPEWQCVDINGEPKKLGVGAEWGGNLPVMCLASPYREKAARRISDLVARYNLGYVKIDLDTVFNAYGKTTPGCHAKGHFHRNWAESLGGIYAGIQYVTSQIYQEHPEVLLDLTFELWGQKHIIDYGLLGAGDLDWMSNVDDVRASSAGPRQARTLLYDRSLAIPVETMLIGNLQATTASVEERFATAIGSAPLLLGDLRQLSASQVQWYAEKIAWFKELRRRVALNEGFFPLGEWRQPKCTKWDGFARLSREGEGVIVIFKNKTKVEEVRVKIETYPGGAFKVRSVMTGEGIGTYSGEQFRRGVTLAIPDQHDVQIVEIRKA